MKKEISLSKVIRELSIHDTRLNDARILSIHQMVIDDKESCVFRLGSSEGFVRIAAFPLYEEIEESVLTKDEAIKRHRMMWNWIAYETLRREEYVTKKEAIEHFGWNESKMRSKCWCCTYAYEDGTCEDDCPIRWPGVKCTGSIDVDGLYDEWCHSRWYSDYKKAADLAYRIANLPEREDVE